MLLNLLILRVNPGAMEAHLEFVEAHSGVLEYAHPGVVETHPSRLRSSCGYWRNFADLLKGQGQHI